MKPRDRVIAQLRHKETDYLPYVLGFEGDVFERVCDHYGGSQWFDRIETYFTPVAIPTLGWTGPSCTLDESGSLSTDIFGSVWRLDGRPAHLVRPALAHPDTADLEIPPTHRIFPEKFEEGAVSAIRESPDTFHTAHFGFGLFERLWTLRGFENVLADSVAEPDFFEELVLRVADHQMVLVDRLVELPVDAVYFSDDWGDQRGVILGPDRWRRFIKPHLARMYARVHEAGMFTISHCCGNVVDIIPDLIEIGLDCLQSIQPEAMDPYTLKRGWGGRLTFYGGLGSQRLLPFGAPEDVRIEVRRLCREMGRGGGYVLGLAKAFQPETPTLNAVAAIEEFLAQAGVRIS